MGDLWSSSLGQIAGGRGGDGAFVYNSVGLGTSDLNAKPLGGGGTMYAESIANSTTSAGHASIGGGGGTCINKQSSSYQTSGRGGEGLVVIQYIP
jgi:hypothetical protein